MKKFAYFIGLFFVGWGVLSHLSLKQALANPAHREQKAHVHGVAQLAIAFDGPQGEIDYDGAGLNIYGFEHQAKTLADKKTQKDALKKFEDNISKIIQWEDSLKCRWQHSTVDLEQEGGHSDVRGQFKVTCIKSPLGSQVKINFAPFFPTLNRLNIQLMVDNFQKQIKIEKFPTEFEIK